MSRDPSITFFILTPTHNRVDRLEKTIESVQAQSHARWQHFILDDGSSDETPRLLARHRDDARIHSWRFDANQGVNAARNFLLDRILEREEPGFIVILDDDDRLEKDALTRLAEAAQQHPSARWFIANCHLPDGRRISQIRGAYRPLCYVRDHKLGDQLIGDVAHAFHTSIVEGIRFIDAFPNSEEWWFYAGLARRSPMRALDVHAKTVEYLENGLTRRKPNRQHKGKIYQLKLERFAPFLDRRQRAALEVRIGRHLYARGERAKGLRHLARALLRWPFEYRIYTYALEMSLRSIRQGIGRVPADR